jgi:L-lactate dehydrogenase complex protein LldF
MTDVFRSRIRASLADANLQSALDANAERRISVRQQAFASLADPQSLRQRAHSVRADVIEHLDGYLAQFIAHAHENGMQIHHAADADQAIGIVLEIARQRGAKLIAKSKTMVSEEIGLNHALEEQGLQVIETDLGEYIVQLRHESPSHIITPAVHLRRQDVGKLFEQKLGLPYTEDIGTMTDAARRALREVFLNADIGISGVNFGVAGTGTLCVVTNEGNGRMVTTVPPVHIALMGIERLVPNLDDLALMLSLLPRSATGQKLSVYTSLLHGPRRSGDPDGPLERHVILVDNGRLACQSSGLAEILYCIRCGACLNACPVFREIGGHAYVSLDGKGSPYSGPMGSVVSPALFGQLEYGHLARASSLCGACREACPVDIDLPKLLLRIRSGVQVKPSAYLPTPNAPAPLALGLHFFTLAATSPWRYTIAQWLAGLLGSVASVFSPRDPWIRFPALTGWGYSKDFPRPATRTFRSRYLRHVSHQRDLSHADRDVLPPVAGQEAKLPIAAQQGSLIQIFSSELVALGAKFILCTSDEVPDKVIEILHGRGVNEILAWDAEHLSPDLLSQLTNAGIIVDHPTRESQGTHSRVRAGLTGVVAAVAGTGSLLLHSGSGYPLTASLLPEVHIALIRERDIYENLAQVLNLPELTASSAAVLVSGPSRTADIEMTLTIGVHGPGELHVIAIKS